MEKGLMEDMYEYFRQQFQLQEVDVKTYSPLTLAYIGDSIYDLLIKMLIVNQGNKQVNKLHKKTSALVKAPTQSMMMEGLMNLLTGEELAIYKRGRNAKSFTTAKNASVSEYRRATGFEALLGYLFLEKKYQRLVDLVKAGLQWYEKKHQA